MIYLLWAAVVGMAVAVLWLSFKVNALDGALVHLDHAAADSIRAQYAVNNRLKEKLRLVGQHID